jgi:hypothetical protein
MLTYSRALSAVSDTARSVSLGSCLVALELCARSAV